MTTVMRRGGPMAGLSGGNSSGLGRRRGRGGTIVAVIVLAFVVVTAVLGVLAWRAGGPQPVSAVVIPLPVPAAGSTAGGAAQ